MLFVVYVVLLLLCNGSRGALDGKKIRKKKQKKRLLVAKKNNKGSSFLSSPPLSSESSSFASRASSSSLARSYQRNNRFWKNEAYFPAEKGNRSYYHIARCRSHSLPRISTPPPHGILLFVLLLVVDENDPDVDAFPS